MASTTRFHGVTLIAALEVFVIVRVLPGHYNFGDASLGRTACSVFAVNYLLLVLYLRVIHPRFFSPLRKFPKPKNVLWRTIYSRFTGREAPGDLVLMLDREVPNNGILALGRGRLLLTRPGPVADVLVHHPYDFVKPSQIRNFLRRILGDGLIIVEGDQHRFLRKNTMPAFRFRHIKDLYPMMWRKSLSLISALERHLAGQLAARHGGLDGDEIRTVEGAKVEISGWASKITLDIIGIAGLGREFNTLQNSDDELAQHYAALLEPSREKVIYFLMMTWVSSRLTQMLPWKMNATFAHRTASLKNICNTLVREKREAVLKKGDEHFDILSLLIKSDNFSDSELSDQLLTYLAAGHETTSSGFTWACYLLAAHPRMQARLRAEVRGALSPGADSQDDVDLAATMERLPYLNAIINETLRLYPTVPITVRVALHDTDVTGHFIPAGTEMVISPWLMNRSPVLWGDDAAVFRPERWIDVDGATGQCRTNNTGGASSNYDYMTFLHGPRSCIGQNFAKAELRCLVASFVRTFEWTLDMDEKDIVPGGAITIKPGKGLHVKLRMAPEQD